MSNEEDIYRKQLIKTHTKTKEFKKKEYKDYTKTLQQMLKRREKEAI